jgi:hypothetical protein
MTYQSTDGDIIDYDIVTLPGTRDLIRGPLPKNFDEGGYICAIGAAQTFGRFATKPFLWLLGETLNMETLNLGLAGGGPRHFARRAGMLAAANRASLVILQVMSGRSVSNSYFKNPGAGSLVPWFSPPDRIPRHAELEYSELYLREGKDFVQKLLEETRRNYLADYDLLLSRIKVPVLLFWFSTRDSEYKEVYPLGKINPAGAFLGEFPQLIKTAQLDALKGKVIHFAECVTSRGLPQPLRHRVTGEMVDLGITPKHPAHNNYYPSPEMHEDAAKALLPAVRNILDGSQISATVAMNTQIQILTRERS